MNLDNLIRKVHPGLFGSIIFFSIIEMSIAAWVTSQFIAHQTAPNSSIQDRVQFTLFATLWNITFCTVYIVLFFKMATRRLASVASHVAFLFVTWIFWVAAAASITNALGGILNCDTNTYFPYCTQFNALLVFSWIIWILVTLTLIAALCGGIRAAKRGDGFFGSFVDY